MSDAAVTYRLEGRVGFDNLLAVRADGEQAIAEADDNVVVDLSGLEHGNSAAVALLMAWFRAAEGLGKRIVFQGAPKEVTNIIELSGLTEVLPLAPDEAASAAS